MFNLFRHEAHDDTQYIVIDPEPLGTKPDAYAKRRAKVIRAMGEKYCCHPVNFVKKGEVK